MRAFESARDELFRAAGTTITALDHIGSTANPGIYAKPVIDMLAVATDLSALDVQTPTIERLGYEAKGEFGIDGRRYFRRDNAAGLRTHQLHAFARGSPHLRRHLAFRDYLRTHPHDAKRYSELKRRLATAHPDDPDAYMDGKDGLIRELEAEALRWANGK